MTALAIAAAGAVGSLARYGVSAVGRRFGWQVPYPTLAVNVLGSFLIGLVMAYFAGRGDIDSRTRIALTVGFLGGFTTYSAFALETVTLIENGRSLQAGIYAGATLVAGALGCALGLWVGRRLVG